MEHRNFCAFISYRHFSPDGKWIMYANYAKTWFSAASLGSGSKVYEMHAAQPVRSWGFDSATGDAVIVYEDAAPCARIFSPLRRSCLTPRKPWYRAHNRASSTKRSPTEKPPARSFFAQAADAFRVYFSASYMASKEVLISPFSVRMPPRVPFSFQE